MSDLSAMTVNERLYATGLMPAWDAAVQSRDREKLTELLRRIGLENQSTVIVEAVLHPGRLAR